MYNCTWNKKHSIQPLWTNLDLQITACPFVLFVLVVQAELLRALGGVKASASLLGVPLGHNSSFLQGPAFAPPRIREAIWCGSTNSSTEEGTANTIEHTLNVRNITKYLMFLLNRQRIE